MKRIVICCDGTWNRSDAPQPTNVVQVAQAVAPFAKQGRKTIAQMVIYLDGVGSGRGAGPISKFCDRQLGGIFGWGLLENIKDAYRTLIFNYEPGDEIYIFGFSRGAYTARSLAGLLRKSGLLPRHNVNRIDEAVDLYRRTGDLNHPDAAHIWQKRRDLSPDIATSPYDLAQRADDSHLLRITYLGVWDTVGALGVPSVLSTIGFPVNFFNEKYNFHDTELSSSVASARHAVSIDENRATFPPALWHNLDDHDDCFGLNSRFPAPRNRDALYQQLWFAGDHGSVGGGGDFHGLSNITREWVAQGAADQGLGFKTNFLGFNPDETDVCEPVINVHKVSCSKRLLRLVKRHRKQLKSPDHVAESVVLRLKLQGKAYAPPTLDPLRDALQHRIDTLPLTPPK